MIARNNAMPLPLINNMKCGVMVRLISLEIALVAVEHLFS